MAQPEAPVELLAEEPFERLSAMVSGALRRKPAQEARLGGSLRALVPHSSRLGAVTIEVVETLVRRGSFDRPLYAGAVRALPEDAASVSALERSLCSEDAGGLPALSAACAVRSPLLAEPLARAAGSRHPHIAFAAGVARLARGEAGGEHIASLAPMIKEAHRIALCVEIFVPLLRQPALPLSVSPALAVFRDSERHLGRWLVFGEHAVRAGDARPALEANERASTGASSARAAWALVAWALSPSGASTSVRPTVELVSRLSDRPSADKDPTFLYRLAEARLESARPMLESLARPPLRSDSAVRAALYLARDHGRDDLRQTLRHLAQSSRQDAVRGVSAAALFDLGERDGLDEIADSLSKSRQLPTLAWGALLGVGLRGGVDRLLTEPNFRHVQLGWAE